MKREGKNASPFAEFERRAAAAIVDVFAVFFFSIWLMSSTPILASWTPTGRPVLAIIALLYFAGSWASPLSATPSQWLFRFKIVDESGMRLSLVRAVIRAALFIVVAIGVMTLAQVPETPWLLAIVVPSFAAFCIALVTANRQGLHDFVVQTIAVKSSWLDSPQRSAELQEYCRRNATSPLRVVWPGPARIVLAVAVVAVVALGIYNAALVRYEMGLRARISYAYAQTSSLRNALEANYRASGQWESTEAVLGAPTRVDYPDGGYYILEDNGTIRIRFTVIPRLRRISLVVTPEWRDDELTWNCSAEGDIASGVLPAHCRD